MSPTTAAGGTTQVLGVSNNSSFRTNLYLMEATGSVSKVKVEVLDKLQTVVATRWYSLTAWQPMLKSLDRLGADTLAAGSLRVTVTEGAVVAGASRINQGSGDPLTLTSSLQLPGLTGWAAKTLVGRSYYFEVFDPDGVIEEYVVFDTAVEGYVIESGERHDFSYSDYQGLGNIATLSVDLPYLELEGVQMVFSWTSADAGFFFGTFAGDEGEHAMAGTFREQEPPDQ